MINKQQYNVTYDSGDPDLQFVQSLDSRFCGKDSSPGSLAQASQRLKLGVIKIALIFLSINYLESGGAT